MPNETINLPLFVKLNNPAALTAWPGIDARTRTINGKVCFPSAMMGLQAAFHDINQRYSVRGLVTVKAYLADAMATHDVDQLAMRRTICERLHLSPLKCETQAMSLTEAWRATDFLRALIRAVNGEAPPGGDGGGEWYRPEMVTAALLASGHWRQQ